MIQRRKIQKLKGINNIKSISSIQKYLLLRFTGILAQIDKNTIRNKLENPCLKPNVISMSKSSAHKVQSVCSTAATSPNKYKVLEIKENPFKISKKQIYTKHRRERTQCQLSQIKRECQGIEYYNLFFEEQKQPQPAKQKKGYNKRSLFENRLISAKSRKFQTQSMEISQNFLGGCAQPKNKKIKQRNRYVRPWTSVKCTDSKKFQKTSKIDTNIFHPAPLYVLEESESNVFNPWDVQSRDSSRIQNS